MGAIPEDQTPSGRSCQGRAMMQAERTTAFAGAQRRSGYRAMVGGRLRLLETPAGAELA